jgi:hypothetical protein
MATLHPTNSYNVEASLNTWFQAQLATYVSPPTIPTTALTVLMPESGIAPPAFSMFHIPVLLQDKWQGRNAGDGLAGMQAHALAQIDVWVTRANTNWMQQKRVMQSIVEDIWVRNPVVLVSSYATAATPSATVYKINMGNLEIVQTNPDANPDIERVRMLGNYEWVRRA